MSNGTPNTLPGGIRRGALLLIAGYAALLLSLVLKKALALTILLPLGTLFILAGIVLWALTAFREAQSKGLV
jgi:hypothetical protein